MDMRECSAFVGEGFRDRRGGHAQMEWMFYLTYKSTVNYFVIYLVNFEPQFDTKFNVFN